MTCPVELGEHFLCHGCGQGMAGPHADMRGNECGPVEHFIEVCGEPITGSGPCATCGHTCAHPREGMAYFCHECEAEHVRGVFRPGVDTYHSYAPSVFTCAAGHTQPAAQL